MRRIGIVISSMALVLAACAHAEEDRSISIAIESGPRCVYQGPDALRSGPVALTFDNPLKVPTWVHFVRLDEGRSVEEFADRFDTIPGGGLPGWSTLVWGFLVVDPETTITGEADLYEGLYGMVCGTVSPDRGFFAGGLKVDD